MQRIGDKNAISFSKDSQRLETNQKPRSSVWQSLSGEIVTLEIKTSGLFQDLRSSDVKSGSLEVHFLSSKPNLASS